MKCQAKAKETLIQWVTYFSLLSEKFQVMKYIFLIIFYDIICFLVFAFKMGNFNYKIKSLNYLMIMRAIRLLFSGWSKQMKRFSIPFLFLATLVFFFYLLCLQFGYIPFFQMLLERLSFSLGRRALSFALCKGLGCSGGLAFAILYLYALTEAPFLGNTEAPFLGNKMLPGDASSGASTSNQGQSSMGGQIPASTSQPTEVAHRSDPLLTAPDEIKKPLIVDDLRQKELEKRLNFHFIGKSEEIDTPPYSDCVDAQLLIEKQIEISLRNDGYSRESILANLNAIRGYLFYPEGVPLKNSTLTHHLREMQKGNNIPYARIKRAIKDLDIFLVKGE